MDKQQAADNLEEALKAFKRRLSIRADPQQSTQFIALNNAIRQGLKAAGEDPMDVDTLTKRGIFNTPQNEPIPDSYVAGVEKLIEDLKASDE